MENPRSVAGMYRGGGGVHKGWVPITSGATAHSVVRRAEIQLGAVGAHQMKSSTNSFRRSSMKI